MIGDYIYAAHSEEQREALLQTVQAFREEVPDITKASLAKC